MAALAQVVEGRPAQVGCQFTTRDWWIDKIDWNRVRDQQITELLITAGWRVIRIWEHDDPATAALAVRSALPGRDHPTDGPRTARQGKGNSPQHPH